jgi:hypothetical protein
MLTHGPHHVEKVAKDFHQLTLLLSFLGQIRKFHRRTVKTMTAESMEAVPPVPHKAFDTILTLDFGYAPPSRRLM